MGILEQFPVLSQEDLDRVNDCFPHYGFYLREGAGRLWWTSCCHEKGRFLSLSSERVTTHEIREATDAWHGKQITCPFCGKTITVYQRGKAKECQKLVAYRKAMVIHTSQSGKTVWAQEYNVMKRYNFKGAGAWANYPEYTPVAAYQLRRGEVVSWTWSWFGKEWSPPKVNGFGPFGGVDDVIGEERLAKSFLKYIPNPWMYRDKMGRFLGLCAQYPESVEMALKLKVDSLVREWLYNRRKNSRIFQWGEKDAKKAFGLDGQELRAFLKGEKRILSLAYYKRCRKKQLGISMEDALLVGDSHYVGEVGAIAKEYGVTEKWLIGYIKRQMGDSSFGATVRHWQDYIRGAAAQELELWKRNVLFPSRLGEAHDAVWAERNEVLRLEREREKRESEERERLREAKAKAEYEKRYNTLVRKYQMEHGGLMVVVPKDGAEIKAEGIALSHCVGGYADRHMKGKVTILFLRKVKEPDVPFITIEMDGDKMEQIHGYRNEGIHTREGRFAPPPEDVYGWFLKPWLAWVAGGSKRKKGVAVTPAAVS